MAYVHVDRSHQALMSTLVQQLLCIPHARDITIVYGIVLCADGHECPHHIDLTVYPDFYFLLNDYLTTLYANMTMRLWGNHNFSIHIQFHNYTHTHTHTPPPPQPHHVKCIR